MKVSYCCDFPEGEDIKRLKTEEAVLKLCFQSLTIMERTRNPRCGMTRAVSEIKNARKRTICKAEAGMM